MPTAWWEHAESLVRAQDGKVGVVPDERPLN